MEENSDQIVNIFENNITWQVTWLRKSQQQVPLFATSVNV